MEELFKEPPLSGNPDQDGWIEEVVRYRVQPRPKPKFRTVLDPSKVFGTGDARFTVTTRTQPGKAFELHTRAQLPTAALEETLRCDVDGGLRVAELERRFGDARHERVDFGSPALALPPTTYPEVHIPFLMRGQPRDGKTRALHSWTNDRFLARVYYESRGTDAHGVKVWMYPDLNDWIALGSMITRLAKPLLPRYAFWFESDPPYRVTRFEGPFGPPGAPEIVLELIR